MDRGRTGQWPRANDQHRGYGLTMQIEPPTLDAIRANRARLGDLVVTTPIRLLVDDALAPAVGSSTRVWLKEELFQRTGSFKPRGALSVMLDLDAGALARGVTGVSAGNHAISLGYCARALGTTAKVVMPKTANPFRIQVCRELGATVELVDNVHAAFDRVEAIVAAEGRTFVHPFEGPKTALGTASVGMELIDQIDAAGYEPRRGDRGGRRRWAHWRRCLRRETDEPGDRRLRRRARRRRQSEPQLRGGIASGDRRRADDRRLPGRAAVRALFLRAQPAVRRRRRAGQRRSDPGGDAPDVPCRRSSRSSPPVRPRWRG